MVTLMISKISISYVCRCSIVQSKTFGVDEPIARTLKCFACGSEAEMDPKMTRVICD